MFEKLYYFLFFFNLMSQAHNLPLHEEDVIGRGLVPRLKAFNARQMEAFDEKQMEARQLETRLALLGPQELEAIKRVAQLLAMFGEQVIPVIIGDNPAHRPTGAPNTITEVPSDPVELNI